MGRWEEERREEELPEFLSTPEAEANSVGDRILCQHERNLQVRYGPRSVVVNPGSQGRGIRVCTRQDEIALVSAYCSRDDVRRFAIFDERMHKQRSLKGRVFQVRQQHGCIFAADRCCGDVVAFAPGGRAESCRADRARGVVVDDGSKCAGVTG